MVIWQKTSCAISEAFFEPLAEFVAGVGDVALGMYRDFTACVDAEANALDDIVRIHSHWLAVSGDCGFYIVHDLFYLRCLAKINLTFQANDDIVDMC